MAGAIAVRLERHPKRLDKARMYIMTLGVKERYRRRQLGTRAMEQILKLLRATTRAEHRRGSDDGCGGNVDGVDAAERRRGEEARRDDGGRSMRNMRSPALRSTAFSVYTSRSAPTTAGERAPAKQRLKRAARRVRWRPCLRVWLRGGAR